MARCPVCQAITPTGCNCVAADTDYYTIAGNGDDGSCFKVNPVLSGNPDNILSVSPAGILALLPAEITDPPACKVYKTTNTTCANNSTVALTFNGVYFDTDTMHSGALPGRITFTTGGVYAVTLNCTWQKHDDDGFREAFIRMNGTGSLALGADERNNGDPDLFVAHSVTAIRVIWLISRGALAQETM